MISRRGFGRSFSPKILLTGNPPKEKAKIKAGEKEDYLKREVSRV